MVIFGTEFALVSFLVGKCTNLDVILAVPFDLKFYPKNKEEEKEKVKQRPPANITYVQIDASKHGISELLHLIVK